VTYSINRGEKRKQKAIFSLPNGERPGVSCPVNVEGQENVQAKIANKVEGLVREKFNRRTKYKGSKGVAIITGVEIRPWGVNQHGLDLSKKQRKQTTKRTEKTNTHQLNVRRYAQ